ncbi:transcriptional regulator [candidate division KSB1 bacterium]|nr:transcriptional regulator [candidate division KSB1 bacterium]
MLSAELEKVVGVWPLISNIVMVPRTEEEYDRMVALLDELIDEVGEDEKHPWASLMDTLGTLIEAYEDKHFPEPVGDPISSLAFFMEEHGVSQDELPEIGSQTEVAEVLSRKRELNIPQIRSLSKRFNVSPEIFL